MHRRRGGRSIREKTANSSANMQTKNLLGNLTGTLLRSAVRVNRALTTTLSRLATVATPLAGVMPRAKYEVAPVV